MKRLLANLFGATDRPAARRRVGFRPTLRALEARLAPASIRADFNGDLVDDLAIGFPQATASDAPSAFNAGAVQVLYGVEGAGLNSAGTQFLRHDQQQSEAFFGHSLAAGDFNGDGHDDLAVGIPGHDLSPALTDAGAVMIFFGSEDGLRLDNRQLLHEDVANFAGTAKAFEAFGWALAAGNFDGSGPDDLAIGAPIAVGSDAGDLVGVVDVVFGTAGTGLSPGSAVQLLQGEGGVPGQSEQGDAFGAALAAGDFNGDRVDDLAIGVPFEGLGAVDNVGAVNVVFGTRRGMATAGNQIWTQNSAVIGQPFVGTGIVEIHDVTEADDRFGFALAAADFNGDGRADLAIGVPGENLGGVVDAGAVNVLFGSFTGLMGGASLGAPVVTQFLHQNRPNIADTNEAGDQFGFALAAGDFNGDGRADLAVGTPGENVGTVRDAGGVIIIRGGFAGLAHGSFALTQTTDNLTSTRPDAGDQFGYALSVGDFDGDGRDDLAVGIPFEDAGNSEFRETDSGQVEVIRFTANGLGVASAQKWDWLNLSFNAAAAWGEFDPSFGFFGSAL